MSEPHPVTGYVLAGGRSVRMGRDKALLPLAGKPLIQHAVEKLQSVCLRTYILSSRVEVATYAPLVPDLHPGCGPLGGMEAALLHTATDWTLFLAVDMPFVPGNFLVNWLHQVLSCKTACVALFSIDGIPQPTLCLVHRDIAPFVQAAITRGEYRVLPCLEHAARELADRDCLPPDSVLLQRDLPDEGFFANLNTPLEFAAAETHVARVHSVQDQSREERQRAG